MFVPASRSSEVRQAGAGCAEMGAAKIIICATFGIFVIVLISLHNMLVGTSSPPEGWAGEESIPRDDPFPARRIGGIGILKKNNLRSHGRDESNKSGNDKGAKGSGNDDSLGPVSGDKKFEHFLHPGHLMESHSESEEALAAREYVASVSRSYAVFEEPSCPQSPEAGYPKHYPVLDVLENWQPDEPDKRPDKIFNSLCYFDYSDLAQRAQAVRYRDAEVREFDVSKVDVVVVVVVVGVVVSGVVWCGAVWCGAVRYGAV